MDTISIINQGKVFYKAGQRAEARRCFEQALRQDKQNETAWLWLAGVVTDPNERRLYLENVLSINPDNASAQKGLSKLAQTAGTATATRPHPKPVVRAIEPVVRATEPVARTTKPAPAQRMPEPPPLANKPSAAQMAAAAYAEPSKNAVDQKTVWIIGAGMLLLLLVVGGMAWALLGEVSQSLAERSAADAAAASTTATGSIAQQPAVSLDPGAIFAPLYENIAAHNAEDADRYMATIHSRASGRSATRNMLDEMYPDYQLDTQISDLVLLSATEREARVSFVMITRKISGPDFRDNRLEGVFILRPENGQWKLYNQTVDSVDYLD